MVSQREAIKGGKRTRLMKEVQARFDGRPLVDLIVEGINQDGLSQTAAELGISKASLGYWILKLNITVQRVALKPNERIEIVRTT